MSQPLSALLAGRPATSQPDRAHQLLLAQRLAEAVAARHAAGGVMGNLDDARVLVAPDGTFVLDDGAAGAPETSTRAYTAPELQGSRMGRIRPEAQHDAFALAVLLFQLLMEGHHPYAGQWIGGGDLPDIPKAIQLGLYAYGGSAATPPPGAPALSTLEPGLADLFARSFAPTSAIFRSRPTAAEWARALATARQADAATAPPPLVAIPVSPPEPGPGPAAAPSLLSPMADAAAGAASHALPTAVPRVLPPNPALPAQEPWRPVPANPPDLARLPRAGAGASPEKRKVSRRTSPPRAVPRDVASSEPPRLAQSERSWASLWSEPVRDLLADMAAWKQVILLSVGFLLFLIVLVLAGGSDDWANPSARPAVVQATRVATTQTPQPWPTATRIAVNNPTVASFGSNFDITDRVIPSTGERFSAYVRDKALRLEVVGKGARGEAMFNAAPATADFHFTTRVGATTGQGEILIYVHELEARQTWVFTVDPAAGTWELSREPATGNTLTPVIAPLEYRSAMAREPVRTITVTRKGGRTSIQINGTPVSYGASRDMPEITGPVKVGVGAMIPDASAYDDEPFAVTVERVAMLADET